MQTVLEDKKVKTRKPHVCYGCQREFESGNTMRYWKGVSEDGFNRLYFCEPCDTHSRDFTDDDWEITRPGDIGYWKNDQWHPVKY